MYTIVKFNNKMVPTMMLHNVHLLYEGFIYVHIVRSWNNSFHFLIHSTTSHRLNFDIMKKLLSDSSQPKELSIQTSYKYLFRTVIVLCAGHIKT